jgi:hypothetical protein
MNCDIRPAAYGIDWRVFPGLETTAVDEIMGGFPVVVDCKSVCCGLDWGDTLPSSQSPMMENCAARSRGTRSIENIQYGETFCVCCSNIGSPGA